MKKYTFTYTKKELLESCVKILWHNKRRRLIILIFPVYFLLSRFVLSSRELSYGILFLLAIYVSLTIGIMYHRFVKEKFLQERSVWTENGLLKYSNGSGCNEFPCNQICKILRGRRLIMLGISQDANQTIWITIPARLFENSAERDTFLLNLYAPVQALESTETEPEDFHFSFFMDENRWVQIQLDVVSASRHKTSYRLKNFLLRILFFVLVCLAAIFYLSKLGIASLPTSIAIVFFIFLALLWRIANPEAGIRRTIRKSAAENNLLGEWHVWFTASGISYAIMGKRKVKIPWTTFEWLAETEQGFYFMRQNNRQFLCIPKNCLSSPEQASSWLQYCQSKGYTAEKVRRAKFMPSWLYIALLVLGFLGLLVSGMYSAMDQNRQRREQRSLDGQVSTLRSLGLEISDETVDRIREYQDEEFTKQYLQDYPYTWLLMDLGMPEYDENYEITAYPENVYWFDFESWDLESDYVNILTGMAVLAKGSPLNAVENIRINMDQVDWDAGTGTLEILLDWNQETLTYPMDVQYDWIDPAVLGIYNELLEKTDAKERFYGIGDGGQGVLLFYCDKSWAKSFEKLTGITMEEL